MITRKADVAVIGAGPAGMAAAIKAKENGLENVIILERAESPGGLLHQCIHNGFGLHYFGKDLTGPEYAESFIDKLNSAGVQLVLDTMVTHIYPDRSITAINSTWGEFKVEAGAIVLAMGCRERSRFQIGLGIPGSRPAGVLTAGLAQRLVNVDGYLPGREFVILGSGDVGMIMARRLYLEGAEVKAVIEMLPYVGGLIRNEVQCLHDFDIPLLLEHTVTEIYGNDRIEGVKVAQVENGRILEDTEREISCDCLLLSVGLIPENELSREAGIQLCDETGGPFVDEYLQTTIPGIFACGNVVQVYDLVDTVSTEAEKAGQAAADYVKNSLPGHTKDIQITLSGNVRSVVPQQITGDGGEVELLLRIKQPLRNAVITAGNYRKKYNVLTPSEIVKLPLKPQDYRGCADKGVMEVNCFEEDKA